LLAAGIAGWAIGETDDKFVAARSGRGDAKALCIAVGPLGGALQAGTEAAKSEAAIAPALLALAIGVALVSTLVVRAAVESRRARAARAFAAVISTGLFLAVGNAHPFALAKGRALGTLGTITAVAAAAVRPAVFVAAFGLAAAEPFAAGH